MKGAWTQLTMTEAQRDVFLHRIRGAVSAEDYRLIEGMARALPKLVELLEKDPLLLHKFQHLLFGPKTEKSEMIFPEPVDAPSPPPPPAAKPKVKGHGRNAGREYTGAQWTQVNHATLKPGDRCSRCQKGTLREQALPGLVLRITAAPPIAAKGWGLQKLRCDTCGEVFSASAPPQAGQEKYDASVGVMVGLLRYGSGMPHYRLARLQESLGVPLPESTQWELMAPLARTVEMVFRELIGQAAQASVLHNDDTTMRIGELRRLAHPGPDPKRKGTFTTGILAQAGEHSIALFFTGWQHAGENLAKVLEQRSRELEAPIQMCDALSRNTSGLFDSEVAHCLSHGRREFVSLAPAFPEPCQFVLEQIREVYRCESEAKAQGLGSQERLAHHQGHSLPVMEKLHGWMSQQMDDKQVEPNSGLGQAIGYMLRHWEALTLFLRKAGAPLDNNICERALKMAILHRKNSLGYKTLKGARVGDGFMSLIHTCRLNQINPFDYLMALARGGEALAVRPQDWLPWNYPKPAPSADTG